jgi:hypothetical protein
MRRLTAFGMIIGALLAAPSAHASCLKIEGLVMDHTTGDPVDGALARLYKNGVKVDAEMTTGRGRFIFQLDNNAQYIIRVGMEGRVTKCFQVLTYGPEWEGANMVCELEVEVSLVERIPGMDLSFFDMPLGLAKFEPLTGSIVWNRAYEQGIVPKWTSVMLEYQARRDELALKP